MSSPNHEEEKIQEMALVKYNFLFQTSGTINNKNALFKWFFSSLFHIKYPNRGR